jgi:hypothetical protein
MNINRLSVAAGSAFAMVALVVACSSSSSSGTGSSSGTSGASSSGTSGASSSGSSGASSSGSSGASSSGSSGGGQCSIAPGTYKIHYTGAAANGATCPAIPDQTITVSPSDGGASDAGNPAGCTISNDAATCTTTVDCTTDTNGFSTVSHSKTTISGTTVTGSSSNKTTQDADGGVLSDCAYDFTWTKQ